MADWLTEAMAKVDKRADLVGRLVTAAVKGILISAFVGAIVLLTVASSTGWPQPTLWVLIVLTLITATPTILELLDRMAPNAATRRYECPFRWLAATVGRTIRRRALRRIFELQGMEEVAARVLSSDEAATYTIAREQRRLRLVRRRVAGLLAVVVVTGSAGYLLSTHTATSDAHVTTGQPFLLGDAFQVIVQSAPTCVAKTTGTGVVCTTVVRFMNVSHEDQAIGPGSFGSIGPQRSLFYEYQDYAIAVVRGGDYFTLQQADFTQTSLKAGESTWATFAFGVRDGVNELDELVMKVRGAEGLIHVYLG